MAHEDGEERDGDDGGLHVELLPGNTGKLSLSGEILSEW